MGIVVVGEDHTGGHVESGHGGLVWFWVFWGG